MRTTHKLAIHSIPLNGRPGDLDYARQLQPRSIKIVDPDVQKASDFHKAAPGALMTLRNHPISEQKDDMRRDPTGTGRRHAQELADWVDAMNDQAASRGLPFPARNQIAVPGINEPPVWSHLQQTVDYNVALLDGLFGAGLRGLGLNLSVGWPANRGGDSPPDWTPFEPVHDAIRRGNHFLCVHEYFSAESYNWGWWCGRVDHCPWDDVEIIIGEFGLDQYVADGSVPANRRGWQGQVSGETHVRQVAAYLQHINRDPRIHSAQLYTLDFSHPWSSFDVDPIRDQLVQVAFQHPMPSQPAPKPPSPVRPRPPGKPALAANEARVLYPLNQRTGPGAGFEELRLLDVHDVLRIVDGPHAADGYLWLYLEHKEGSGWSAISTAKGMPFLELGSGYAIETRPLSMPSATDYRVSQRFGVNRKNYERYSYDGVALRGHNGLDFAIPTGMPILSCADGVVVESHHDVGGWGKYVKVLHSEDDGAGDVEQTLYAHLSQIDVEIGDNVTRGQRLGLSGNTGRSTGPHLHLGIRRRFHIRGDGWGGYSDPATRLPIK